MKLNYKFFCGIDVSKATLDFEICNQERSKISSGKLDNSEKSINKWFKRLLSELDCDKDQLLICLEHSGIYSNILCYSLLRLGACFALESPLNVKLTLGLTRGKDDQIDAGRLADYANRHSDKIRLFTANNIVAAELKQLLSYREALVTRKAAEQAQINEYALFYSKRIIDLMKADYRKRLKLLADQIESIDQNINDFILSHQQLSEQYKLLKSVDGIGPVLAATLIAYTSAFTSIKDPRAFACYAGVAPFRYVSGTSLNSKNRVSHRANKRLKSLLHMAALTTVNSNNELNQYYRRKVSEGKNKMLVLNNIRNKIIHRAFAVIKHKKPYERITLSFG